MICLDPPTYEITRFDGTRIARVRSGRLFDVCRIQGIIARIRNFDRLATSMTRPTSPHPSPSTGRPRRRPAPQIARGTSSGRRRARENLRVFIEAARKRGEGDGPCAVLRPTTGPRQDNAGADRGAGNSAPASRATQRPGDRQGGAILPRCSPISSLTTCSSSTKSTASIPWSRRGAVPGNGGTARSTS